MSVGKHKWTFTARFRAGAYSWKASRLACQRLREAVSEIKKVAKHDPVLGAEGAVRLMEKIWPALEHVDSSSGALGSAVHKTLDALIPIIVKVFFALYSSSVENIIVFIANMNIYVSTNFCIC